MAARLNRRHQDFVREKIRASQLINRLEDHALGEIEMTSTQIKAAEVLLKKCIPDLSAVEYTGEMTMTPARQMTDDELAAIASGGSEGAADETGSTNQP